MGIYPGFYENHSFENACGSGNACFPNYMTAISRNSPISGISCNRSYSQKYYLFALRLVLTILSLHNFCMIFLHNLSRQKLCIFCREENMQTLCRTSFLLHNFFPPFDANFCITCMLKKERAWRELTFSRNCELSFRINLSVQEDAENSSNTYFVSALLPKYLANYCQKIG